ncbi:MFS transporter [Asanoa sp. WMMD1127]|uniref:MFS transporter n=1 Tax=Asanoa sp. WMMD1127 TaxID=3016107 RepID=UPI0024161C71|nr:MFS transporter [Asanoa sp. WMMD1127]MDG4823380.1 MFS transporter [Asanoa sp. WMMD1127]
MRRNEWLLVSFTVATNLADAVTKVALPLLAVRITDQPAAVAAVAALLTLPWLLTALHVGVLVDRLDRRRLMVAAELARIAAIAVLLGAVLGGLVSLPLLYTVALALGVAEVVALTAGASIVPAAVRRERWPLVTARITAAEYLCNGFLGAPVGGFLVAAGFALALGVTGVVYVAGAVLLLLLAGAFRPAPRERRPVGREIRDGLGFLLRNRLLRTMALLIAAMAGAWSAWLALIPAYAVAGPLGLDERRFGLLLTALGAGGVIGALLVGRVNRLLGRRWSMFADIIGSCALVAVPALVARPIPVAVAAFVAGVGGTMWTVNSRVIIQSAVPDGMLGRFNAASRLVGWGTTPIAAALAGVLAQTLGYRVAFGAFAILCALLVIPFLKVVTDDALTAALAPAEPTAREAVPAP